MTGYVFTYRVGGFGADIAPAHEEGVYLNYESAFNHLCALNAPLIKDNYYDLSYNGDVKEICKDIIKNVDPPLGMYSMEEIEIYE
ncbi:MAG: hypothetical protein LIR50_21805 [Bacillota bacterium]|nr:hypothetical protein [Bacillota bacterium]